MAELSFWDWALALGLIAFGSIFLILILVGVAGADQERIDRWWGE